MIFYFEETPPKDSMGLIKPTRLSRRIWVRNRTRGQKVTVVLAVTARKRKRADTWTISTFIQPILSGALIFQLIAPIAMTNDSQKNQKGEKDKQMQYTKTVMRRRTNRQRLGTSPFVLKGQFSSCTCW